MAASDIQSAKICVTLVLAAIACEDGCVTFTPTRVQNLIEHQALTLNVTTKWVNCRKDAIFLQLFVHALGRFPKQGHSWLPHLSVLLVSRTT